MENHSQIKAQIITLAMLKAEGIRVAFIKGNRQVQERNVNAKWASLRDYGQCTPAVIVDGEEVKAANLEIVDAETGKPVAPEDYNKYVVILDGQHRYTAYTRNEKSKGESMGEFYFMYPLNERVSPQEFLAEANCQMKPWDAASYSKGLILLNPDKKLPVVEMMNELMDLGVDLSTARRYAYLKNESKVDSTMLARGIKGDVDPLLKKEDNLEKGRKLWKASLNKFSISLLKHRYFVDFFIGKYECAENREGLCDRFVEFIESMSKKDVEVIEKAKGKKGVISKEELVVMKLNELYNVKYGEENN